MKIFLKRSCLVLLFLLSINYTVKAGIITRNASIKGNAIIQNAIVPLQEDVYEYTTNYSQSLWGFNDKATNNRIYLRYTGANKKYYNAAWNVDVSVSIQRYDKIGNALPLINTVLQITYDPTQPYKDIATYATTGGHKVVVKITNVTMSSNFAGVLPTDIVLENEIEIERYYDLPAFNLPTFPVINQGAINATNNSIELFWDFVPGAEEYDVEWIFVSSYLTPQPATALNADFSNATRISTPNNFHKLNLAFDNGKLFYRFRAVGVSGVAFDQRFESAWVYGANSVPIATNFFTTANWNYEASYAEEGKSNEVVNFFDGSQRTRQKTTINNSDDVALTSETFYDFEGREAITTLPAPVNSYGNKLGYQSNFNLNTLGTFFTKKNFEDGNCTNNYPMNTSSGASNYYSPANTRLLSTSSKMFYPAIPDAFQYPMIRTKYNQENEKYAISGVGADFKLGSGKETIMFKASASQEKLDRIFGNEAGYAQHYNEEVTIDANGQTTVTFKNLAGKVVATAMRGDKPTNVESLKDPVVITDEPYMLDEFTKEDFTVMNQFDATQNGFIISKDFLVTNAGPVNAPNAYTFNYEITPQTFNDLCVNQNFQCKYLLKISFSDNCGNVLNAIAPNTTFLNNYIAIDPANFPTGYSKTFIMNFPANGIYKIKKELVLDPDAIAAYQAQYYALANSPANTCITSLSALENQAYNEMDQEECLTCAQNITIMTNDYINGLYPYPAVPPTGAWQTAYDNFLLIHCNAAEAPVKSCVGLLKKLKKDVSPGGQYFEYIYPAGSTLSNGSSVNTTLATSGPWIDVLNLLNITNPTNFATTFQNYCTANSTCPAPSAFTQAGILSSWNDCYADFLVTFHPEYCRYLTCQGLIPSDSYDYLLQNLNHSTAQNTDASGNICGGPCTPVLTITGSAPYVLSVLTNDPYPSFNASAYTSILNQLNNCTSCAAMVSNPTTPCVPAGSTMWQYAACVPVSLSTSSPTFNDDRWKNFTVLYESYKKTLQSQAGPCFALNDNSVPPDLETDNYAAGNNVGSFASQYYPIPNGMTINDPNLPAVFNNNLAAVTPGPPINFGSNVNQDECVYSNSYINLQLNEAYFTDQCPIFQPTGYNTPFPNPNQPNLCSGLYTNGIKFYVYDVPNYTGQLAISNTISIPNNFASLTNFAILNILANGINSYVSNPDFSALVDNTNPAAPFLKIVAPPSLSPLLLSTSTQIKVGVKRYEFCNDEDDCAYKVFNPSIKHCITQFPECICPLLSQMHAAYVLITPAPVITEYQYMANELNALYFNNFALINATQTQYWYANCQSSGFSPYPLDASNDPIVPVNTNPYYVTAEIKCEPPCNAQAEEEAMYAAAAIFETQVQQSVQNFIKNYVKACLSNINEKFNVQYQEKEYHYTLYYYDQAGNLVRTVPPAAVVRFGSAALYSGPGGSNIVNNARVANTGFIYPGHSVIGQLTNYPTVTTLPPNTFVTNYKYNSFNQLLQQKTPDGGLTNFWYDNLGRLRFSQNDKQAAANCYSGLCGGPFYQYNGLYSYTMYDNLNRIIEVGENEAYYVEIIGSPPFTIINNVPFNSGVNDQTFPAFNGIQVTKTYYNTPLTSNPVSAQFVSGQTHIRNRVASTTYEDVEDNNDNTYNSASHYAYDIHGNVKTLVQENPSLAGLGQNYKKLEYEYDLISGKVNKVAYQAGQGDQFYHKYYYDAANRITNAYTSNNNIIWNREVRYFYYLHGTLARVETGNEKVQGTDNVYTLQGWMKLVNSSVLDAGIDLGGDGNTVNANQYMTSQPDVHDNIARDALGYSLDYYNTDYKSIQSGLENTLTGNISANAAFASNAGLYNGNIRGLTHAYLDPLNEQPIKILSRWFTYDQLNRIKTANNYLQASATNNLGTSLVATNDYYEKFRYDANGNILALTRNAYTASFANNMDNMTYNYIAGSNKLKDVTDVGDNTAPLATFGDIKNQSANNYTYDQIGNLIADAKENISNIEWTLNRKIKRITRSSVSTSNMPDLEFAYDVKGNRIFKLSKPRVSGVLQTQQFWTYTYYVRDAEGNVMATYDRKYNLTGNTFTDSYKLTEQHLYGSERLGVLNRNEVMVYQDYFGFMGYSGDGSLSGISGPQNVNQTTFNYNLVANQLGNKSFELINHLDNVITVISDRKLAYDSNTDGTTDYFMPDVIQSGDQYAFGAPMPGRQYNNGNYRYGFNGKENDNDVKGIGNQQDYGLRIYDPRLGKFFSEDPLSYKFPYYSPYHFAGNSPIHNIDLDGGEDKSYTYKQNGKGYTLVSTIDYNDTQEGFGSLGHGIKVTMINNKGGIETRFYASYSFNTKAPTMDEAICKVLAKPAAAIGKALPKGDIKNSWKYEGKESSPLLKGELGAKITYRAGPLKGTYKAYILDEGNESGVRYMQKGTISSNFTAQEKFKEFSGNVALYWNFTLNNDAGKNSDKEGKLNIQIPLYQGLGFQLSLNSGGISNFEFNFGLSNKPGIEYDGNGDLGKTQDPINTYNGTGWKHWSPSDAPQADSSPAPTNSSFKN